MLKKLLYLYNDGHNPFPHLKGEGGLGYHLPQYRMKGGSGGEYEYDPAVDEEDGGEEDTYEDIYGGVGETKEGDVIPEELTEEEKVKSLISKIDENEIKILFEKLDDDDNYDFVTRGKNKGKDILNNKIRLLKPYEPIEQELPVVELEHDTYSSFEEIQDDIRNYINEEYYDENADFEDQESFLNDIFKIYNEYYIKLYTYTQNNDTEAIKKLKALTLAKLMKHIGGDKIENAKALSDFIKKVPLSKFKSGDNEETIHFEVPTIEPIDITDEEFEQIKKIKLENSDIDEFKNTINDLEKINIENPFNSLYEDKKIIPQSYGARFKNAFTLPEPVKNLTVQIDNISYKGKGGVDFELKVEKNIPLLETIVSTIFGTTLNKVIPQSDVGFEKIDLYADTPEGIKNIELKKYKDYTVEQINYETETAFNNWFWDYKRTLKEEYIEGKNNLKLKIKDPFRKYNRLLGKVTGDENLELDKEKLLKEHIKSGTYYGLPLTLTKARTPTPEEIMKRYPKLKDQHDKMIKYFSDKRRRNESENHLAPLFFVKNALLSDNTYKSFGGKTPFMELKLIPNAYGKKKMMQNALCYPACYLKNIPLTEEIIKAGEDISLEDLQQEKINKILLKQSGNKTPKKGKKSKKGK